MIAFLKPRLKTRSLHPLIRCQVTERSTSQHINLQLILGNQYFSLRTCESWAIMGKICLGWHLDEVIQFRGLSHWKVIKSTEQSRGWLGEKTMAVLSFSSVKNDLLIYWGMIGCWPLGQTRADTVNMAAFQPSAIADLYELSRSQKALGKYFGVGGVSGYWWDLLRPDSHNTLSHFGLCPLGPGSVGHWSTVLWIV